MSLSLFNSFDRLRSLLMTSIVFISLSSFTSPVAAQGLQVYWNVPTFMCHQYGIQFNEVSQDFDIIQNTQDQFRGEKMAILYDPGMFPALIKNPNGSITVRNGGVPQEGDLNKHLMLFQKHMEEQIVPGFSGLGVIDFESWRPIFRQNWASLSLYRDKSVDIERKRHPFLPNNSLTRLATQRFEASGRIFMEKTLQLAKELRPYARWSYYAYPYCFNMSPNQQNVQCDSKVEEDNDRLSWLWSLENVLMPSVYLFNVLSPDERVGLIAGRVHEAQRISAKYYPAKLVIPYWWFKYHDQRNTYLTKEDVVNGFKDMVLRGVNGFVIWGSSEDLNNKIKCQKFQDYLHRVLGPAIIQAKHLVRSTSVNEQSINYLDPKYEINRKPTVFPLLSYPSTF